MALYGQDPELGLLAKLLPKLTSQTVIDVGAERGGVAEGLLRAAATELFALEAHPANVSALRDRLGEDPRVTIMECAVSDGEGTAELRVAVSPDGAPVPFGHTLLERPNTDEITWNESLTVERCSLGSLLAAGTLPRRVGILKVDTEGHDLAVLSGMGDLEPEVVMVEHWQQLPHSLGECPWTIDELLALLRPRGFDHFAFIVHRGEFVTLKWDDADVEPGAMGNLVFVHQRALPGALEEILTCAGQLAEEAVATAQMHARAAAERLVLIDELERTANERLDLIHELTEAARAMREGTSG